MKVSVVVPVFNKARFLEACFESLFVQTYTDFELIAVDDASTDDSLDRLRALRDPRLRIIALPNNVGPGLAAQRGIDEAVGEYIIRADADDLSLPDRIAAQVDKLDLHPELGAVSGHMALVDRPDDLYRVPLDHEALRVELLFGVALFQPAMALRRSVLVQHDIRYREHWPRFGEDWLLQSELAKVTRMANLDRPLVQYRVGPQNSSTGRDRRADLLFLYREAFSSVGFPISEEELELHLYAARHFTKRPTPSTIGAFRAWLHRIEDMNTEREVFVPELLAQRTRRAWDALFHRMPEFGWRNTWAYLKHGGTLDIARLRYLLAVFISGPRASRS
jgi:glycosyltransferase involved in cell wall biosynthesis